MRVLEWISVGNENFHKTIGAIGFLNKKAVAIISFYADGDANYDGKLSAGEWVALHSPVSMKGKAILDVAMHSQANLEVCARDAEFARNTNRMFCKFCVRMIQDGVYAAYFNRGVRTISKSVSSKITSGKIREFAVRKGFEKAVEEAFKAAI